MIHDKLEKKISKLKNGDVNAFDYIYEHTNRSVYFTIFYIVNDKMYAEDILQIRIFARFPLLRNTRKEQTLSAGYVL